MFSHIVRRASPRDAIEIARLLTVLGHPTVEQDIASRWPAWVNAGNTALVAVRAGAKLLGMITLNQMIVLHRPRPVGRITALVVDPATRRVGIGRSLVAAAEATLADAGCGLLEITSNFRFADAHSFYEHLGYNRTSVRLVKDLLQFSGD